MGGYVTRADLTYLRRADGTRFAVHGAGTAVPDDADADHVAELLGRGVLAEQESPAGEPADPQTGDDNEPAAGRRSRRGGA